MRTSPTPGHCFLAAKHSTSPRSYGTAFYSRPRRGRFTFEVSRVSSADAPADFWQRVADDGTVTESNGQHLACEVYRRKIRRARRWFSEAPPRSIGSWYDCLSAGKRERLRRSGAQHAGRRFGRAPVLLVCSSVGDEWRSFTRSLGEHLRNERDLFDRIRQETTGQVEAGATREAHLDMLGSGGFPGWQQVSASCGELELLCAAVGGSDPAGKYWEQFAEARPHAAATYRNLVGIVFCVSDHVHFEMHALRKYILSKLHAVRGAAQLSRLPVAVLCDLTGKNQGVPSAPFLWHQEPDEAWGMPGWYSVTRIMHSADALQALEWVYGARRWLMDGEEGEEEERVDAAAAAAAAAAGGARGGRGGRRCVVS